MGGININRSRMGRININRSRNRINMTSRIRVIGIIRSLFSGCDIRSWWCEIHSLRQHPLEHSDNILEHSESIFESFGCRIAGSPVDLRIARRLIPDCSIVPSCQCVSSKASIPKIFFLQTYLVFFCNCLAPSAGRYVDSELDCRHDLPEHKLILTKRIPFRISNIITTPNWDCTNSIIICKQYYKFYPMSLSNIHVPSYWISVWTVFSLVLEYILNILR